MNLDTMLFMESKVLFNDRIAQPKDGSVTCTISIFSANVAALNISYVEVSRVTNLPWCIFHILCHTQVLS